MTGVHREILVALWRRGACDVRELSRRMELSESLVEQLIEELKEREYIEASAFDNEPRCLGCSMSGRCDRLRSPCGWTFTDKGMASIAQSSAGFPEG